MAATTFGFRYPSLISPGKLVYGEGSGSAEDPYIAELNLPGTNFCVAYFKFLKVTGEGPVKISIDLYQPHFQDWFPLCFNDPETPAELVLAGEDDVVKNYRIPLVITNPLQPLTIISGNETKARLKLVCSGTKIGGWCVADVLSATYASIAPHITPGYINVPTGSLEVKNSGVDVGGWKLLHETSFRAFSTLLNPVVVNGLGVGSHIITFEDVSTPPGDQFVEVVANTVTEVTVSYS